MKLWQWLNGDHECNCGLSVAKLLKTKKATIIDSRTSLDKKESLYVIMCDECKHVFDVRIKVKK